MSAAVRAWRIVGTACGAIAFALTLGPAATGAGAVVGVLAAVGVESIVMNARL